MPYSCPLKVLDSQNDKKRAQACEVATRIGKVNQRAAVDKESQFFCQFEQ